MESGFEYVEGLAGQAEHTISGSKCEHRNLEIDKEQKIQIWESVA